MDTVHRSVYGSDVGYTCISVYHLYCAQRGVASSTSEGGQSIGEQTFAHSFFKGRRGVVPFQTAGIGAHHSNTRRYHRSKGRTISNTKLLPW